MKCSSKYAVITISSDWQNRGRRLADALRFSHIKQQEGISLITEPGQLWKILGKCVTWNDKHEGLLYMETALGWPIQGHINYDEAVRLDTNANACVLRSQCLNVVQHVGIQMPEKGLLRFLVHSMRLLE